MQIRITTDGSTPQAGTRYRVDDGSEELRPGSYLVTLEVQDESAVSFRGRYVTVDDWRGIRVAETVQVAP